MEIKINNFMLNFKTPELRRKMKIEVIRQHSRKKA